MKARLLRLADVLRHSYWFVPTLMALLAMLLAGAMIAWDTWAGPVWLDRVPWLYAAHPGGARLVLSAIGGSMITVAGTVFSVTIAAVVYASGQYGPRLLTNFMSDRGNQVTLGTFIATYLYCLLVLRTIRSPDEAGSGVGFVPNVALLVGVVLALCSIAVLIFFIHHVPSRIHISSVIEDVGARLLTDIDQRFPRFIGAPVVAGETAAGPVAVHDVPDVFGGAPDGSHRARPAAIAATGTGYIQVIDDGALLARASAHDLVLRLHYQPGDFVHVGRTLLEAWPPERCTDETIDALAAAFAIGARRSALQDLRFLVDELVEIAARALSPGVNDPFTAVTCLDWMGAAMSDLAGRDLPSHLRVDADGALRVIAHPVTFERFLEQSFGAMAQYCAADMIASLRYLRALGDVSLGCDDAERLAALAACVDRLEVLSAVSLHGSNRARVGERAQQLRRALAEPAFRRGLRDSAEWLGGTA